MIKRAKALFEQVMIVAPWVILTALVTVALVVPSALQNVLTDIEASSVITRLGLIAFIFGGVGLFVYRRNPALVKRVLNRSNTASSPDIGETVEAPEEKPERKTRFSVPEIGRKQEKSETSPVQETSIGEEKQEDFATSVDDEPMNEDDFYAFLESVSEEKSENG